MLELDSPADTGEDLSQIDDSDLWPASAAETLPLKDTRRRASSHKG